jgi:DNA-binding NtrC family response regulator
MVDRKITKTAKRRQARILVADGDLQVRSRFIGRFQSAGYDAVGAGSGKAMLTKLRSSRFDLLVLDLDMPDLDGFAVLKKVRSEAPHVRVLVTSGCLRGALLEAATWFGAARTMNKAAAKKSLIDVTHRLLGDAA